MGCQNCLESQLQKKNSAIDQDSKICTVTQSVKYTTQCGQIELVSIHAPKVQAQAGFDGNCVASVACLTITAQ